MTRKTRIPGGWKTGALASEDRRALRRLGFRYTPHAGWLNMVESEIRARRTQRLDRRIDNRQKMETETAARQHKRNDGGAKINWMFSTENARNKLPRA